MSKKPIKGTIKQWRQVDFSGGSYIQGYVHGHPLYNEGQMICTSKIQEFDKDSWQVETLNSRYVLGEPWGY